MSSTRKTFYLCGDDTIYREERVDWIGCPVHGVNSCHATTPPTVNATKLENTEASEAFRIFQDRTFDHAELALAQFEDDVSYFQAKEEENAYFMFAITTVNRMKTENPSTLFSDMMENVRTAWKKQNETT
jgi:hypothetical protein